jgi:hypothetical protein
MKRRKIMKISIYNSMKWRLVTIDIEFTEENTTWFDDCENNDDIYMITDFKGGLLISECSYSYPIWIDDISREEIDHDKEKARELLCMVCY